MSKPFHTVGELREFLSRFPDDAPLLCQVVGSESGAWSMYLRGFHGDDCCFKWNPQPAILQMRHPGIKALPMDDEPSPGSGGL